MLIEHTDIYGFKASLRGMRNPMDSWADGDSWVFDQFRNGADHFEDVLGRGNVPAHIIAEMVCEDIQPGFKVMERPIIGPKDLELACKLIRRGGDHRKFLRYIGVSCDFIIPRYVWQEVDTYKVGTVRNSCSTMNTLGKRHLEQEDFENGLPPFFLQELNRAVDEFREADGSKAKRGARVILKDLLPEGFLQRATMQWNYEVGLRAFFSRRGHRLPQWREGCEGSICEWIKSWPYMGHFLAAFESMLKTKAPGTTFTF